jgi:hypothetical protein
MNPSSVTFLRGVDVRLIAGSLPHFRQGNFRSPLNDLLPEVECGDMVIECGTYRGDLENGFTHQDRLDHLAS